MKLNVLFFIILLPILSKADTIDVWSVYYNQRLINSYNAFSNNELVLKGDSIQPGDSISVRYYRDTPCHDCATVLAIENDTHYIFFERSNRGTGAPISFSVDQLLNVKNNGYLRPFLVFYYEGKLARRSDKNLLLRIRLE